MAEAVLRPPPPPPAADFNIVISPESISTQFGGTTSPVPRRMGSLPW
jgi:hypothetical protein